MKRKSMNLQSTPRIAIVGCPGSGKSTLARQIAEKTGHPLIHLDYHYHLPGWVDMPRDAFIARMEQWVQGERWIIDGHYGGSLELRFAAADLVIFLDLPALLCVWRAIKRQGKERPDLRPDVEDPSKFTWEFIKFLGFILSFRKKTMPKILALHEKYPGVAFLHVRSDRQAKGLAKRARM